MINQRRNTTNISIESKWSINHATQTLYKHTNKQTVTKQFNPYKHTKEKQHEHTCQYRNGAIDGNSRDVERMRMPTDPVLSSTSNDNEE